MDTHRILGIDPGYARVGYAVVSVTGNRFKAEAFGCIETDGSLSFVERLAHLQKELIMVIAQNKPDATAVESLYFAKNTKTAMDVSQARGVIMLTLHASGLATHNITPNDVKLGVTGYGGADKAQVQHMTKTLLHLSHIPKPDDAADALAIAIAASHLVTKKS